MSLWRYILRRLALMIPVLLGVITLIFVISYVIPADPAREWAGPRAREEQVQALANRYHLNDPLYVQLEYYIWNLVHGDLGISPTTHRPVLKDLIDYFPATFELAMIAFFLAVFVGVPLGAISAIRRNSWIDHISRVFSLIGVSAPIFWSALLLQFFFYFKLNWLPAGGRISIPINHITGFVLLDSLLQGNWTAFANAITHFILPAFTLAFFIMGYIVRITRSSMLEVLGTEYIVTAKAKGLPTWVIYFRHAFRNAVIPPLTVIGIQFGWLIAGTVLLETIFAWPGMGRYAAASIVLVDLPAMVGYTLVVALMMILSNLFIDILYTIIDPRIRIGKKER